MIEKNSLNKEFVDDLIELINKLITYQNSRVTVVIKVNEAIDNFRKKWQKHK